MAANPFSDWTKPFSEFSKTFGEFKAPSFDVNKIASDVRSDVETCSNVCQIAVKSMQESARRVAEGTRANGEQCLKALKDSAQHASSPETAASKQVDFARNLLDFNVNIIRELAEISAEAAQQMTDVISKRVAEKMKGLSEVASSHAPSHSKKKAA